MQFTHEATVLIDTPRHDVFGHWSILSALPRYLSHLRATAPGEDDELARLVILLDGRHLEFAVERTLCSEDTLCWQSLGDHFDYVLSVAIDPEGDQTRLTVTVAYDPPGFLWDAAQGLGLSRYFQRALESDLRRYAATVVTPRQALLERLVAGG